MGLIAHAPGHTHSLTLGVSLCRVLSFCLGPNRVADSAVQYYAVPLQRAMPLKYFQLELAYTHSPALFASRVFACFSPFPLHLPRLCRFM